MKRTFRLALIIFTLIAPSANVYSEITFSNALAKDISQAYGFYLGQNYSLSEISKKYPSLAGAALVAKMDFEAKFGSSVEGMDELMAAKLPKDWSDLKKRLISEIERSIDSEKISESDARQFIQLVRSRARGEIESPVIETMLLFKSGFQQNPVREFLDGYKYKYSTDGAGKAKGVAFSIEYPITWAAEDGDRPNIVQKFTSGNGRGSEFFMILVKEIPLEPGKQITENDVAEMLNPTDIKDFIPDGGVYLDSGKLTLEQLPGFWLRYQVNSKRMKEEVGSYAIMYIVYFKNKAIMMQGMMFTSFNDQQIVRDSDFQKYEKLFDLMANSLVITSKYK